MGDTPLSIEELRTLEPGTKVLITDMRSGSAHEREAVVNSGLGIPANFYGAVEEYMKLQTSLESGRSFEQVIQFCDLKRKAIWLTLLA
ncbi:MAG: hypothetical protein WC777_02655 [Candidatus Gracilibacteria bacterium]|jgi:hypothetical protein